MPYLNVVLDGLVSRPICDQKFHILVLDLARRRSNVLLSHIFYDYTHSVQNKTEKKLLPSGT